MQAIREIWNHTAPTTYTSNKAIPVANPHPSLLFGVELEIENIPEWDNIKILNGAMHHTEDGSLRNYGREFITTPMTFSNLDHVLRDFFDRNKFNESNYSDRCSIHVHTNVQDITLEQLASICMLYQVFERLLFRWIGHERDRNIFCVPWYDTAHMTFRVVNRLKNGDHWVAGEWQKYTALNLVPVSSQGTIEWRHMNGHNDVNRIMQWCRFIQHIYRIATGLSFEQVQQMLVALNTTSQYNDVMNTVFQDDAKLLRTPGYEIDLEDGVLNMKFSILNPTKEKKSLPQQWPTAVTPTQPNRRVQELIERTQAQRADVWLAEMPRQPIAATTAANFVVMNDIQGEQR